MEKTEKYNTNIKSWAEDDRPREKFAQKGRTSLSDAELMAILIGSGSTDMTAVELSKHILHSVGNNLNGLAKLSLADLMKFKGIGEAKAITIAAALELGRRRKETEAQEVQRLQTPKQFYEYMKPYLHDLSHEEMWLICLSRSMKPKNLHKIGMGGVAGVAVDVKIVLKKAIEDLASSIVLVHNHPSGNLNPSQQDKFMTSNIKAACTFMDIIVIDHIIYSNEGFYSFANEGEL